MMIFLCGKGQAYQTILLDLIDAGHEVAAFTHAEDPSLAMCHRLGIFCTTANVNDQSVWPWHPAVIASVGYLHIIKPATVAEVKGRVFNCHYALLPRHRGRSSVPWAILDGDQVTGVTYHWIDDGIDTGRILLQATCLIHPHYETQASLFEKLHPLAIGYFMAALRLAMLDMSGVEQNNEGDSYHYAGPPYGGEIDPAWDDAYVERFIRAMTYPPLSYATYRGQEVRNFAEFKRIALREVVHA